MEREGEDFAMPAMTFVQWRGKLCPVSIARFPGMARSGQLRLASPRMRGTDVEGEVMAAGAAVRKEPGHYPSSPRPRL